MNSDLVRYELRDEAAWITRVLGDKGKAFGVGGDLQAALIEAGVRA